ncbi:polysaccharide biosynthesis/export family protein [Rivularia sp. UHCC 0363]|uniref:polysaccharide biosynthesis/export family protein n=1 Tax=Rivularia sp. UHCC 0363 TaxID=3110244 RepID=UPI002B20A1D8|nr:polysaccharide biosynthesis/export family protein [Rivularia sp. UHCC 0363]MEA5593558.1 polysaccharide biosynthesis/export family protein [Rivularia sp. UHCC 0363]
MRSFNAFCVASVQVGIFLITASQPVFAQKNNSIEPIPAPPSESEFLAPSPANDGEEVSPVFTRYLLGAGDAIAIFVESPQGAYRLGEGDGITVIVQRFPDLSFQASINRQGTVVVPLVGTVSLQGLTLEQAQARIRAGLNRFVVEPSVTVSLAAQRPPLNFQTRVDLEGNIAVPRLGKVSVQGLTLEEAQEKIRLSLERIQQVDPVVTVSLIAPRLVQVNIAGEIIRPGVYPVTTPTPGVLDVLRIAGGSTQLADLREIQVRRKLIDGSIVSQNIDLYTPLLNGGNFPTLRLQDGDSVIIPRREVGMDDGYDRNIVARSSLAQPVIRVRVLNYANGAIITQNLPSGSSFIDALGSVSIDRADLNEIALVRFDTEQGRAITQKLSGKKALRGDASQNVPLQDNDVIIVGRNLIGKITNVLSNVTRPFFDIQSFVNFFDTFGF